MSWLDYKLLTEAEVREKAYTPLPSANQISGPVFVMISEGDSGPMSQVAGFVIGCEFTASKVKYSIAFPVSPQPVSGLNLYAVVGGIPSDWVEPNTAFKWADAIVPALDSVAEDVFAIIEKAAHSGALGVNGIEEPTEAQKVANDYKVGRLQLYGMPIAIEQPRDSVRSGKSKNGVEWSNRMAAHYGFFEGTKGADGDEVDAFVCSDPESQIAFIINQVDPNTGLFDEHKVMLCAQDLAEAMSCYKMSYSADWKGLGNVIPATINQLKWWLKNGDTTIALTPSALPEEGYKKMKSVEWDGEEPVGVTLDAVLYDVRRHDEDGLLLDAVTLADVIADSDGADVLDALVTPFNKLQRNMERLQALMTRVTEAVKPVAMQISDPFKQRGVANIAVLFELSDGQTITIYFHNPDATPKRILPTDELVSWKWMLNKKDITIIAAPERGQELSIREVSRRTMRLAAKNSAAFQRANGRRSERLQSIATLKAEVEAKEAQLNKLQRAIEVKNQEKEDAYAAAQVLKRAASATPPSLVVAENKPPEQQMDDVVEHYENRAEGIESIVVRTGDDYIVRVINSENGETSTLRARFMDIDDAKYAAQQQAGLIKKGPKPVSLAPVDKLAWEEAVYQSIETQGEMTRSDAQGIVMLQEPLLSAQFADGASPDAAAAAILAASEAGTGSLPTEVSQTAIADPVDPLDEVNIALTLVGMKRVQNNDWASPNFVGEEKLTKRFNVRAYGEPMQFRIDMTMSVPGITGAKKQIGIYHSLPEMLDALERSFAEARGSDVQTAQQAAQTGADAGATAQLVEDDEFVQSVIDGAVDIFDPSLPNRLQEIVGRISGDQDRMVKWNQAVSAFSASMMTAATNRLAS